MRMAVFLLIILLIVPLSSASALTGITENSSFDTNVLFVDATNNNIGVRTTTATQKLNVTGTISASGNISAGTNICIQGGTCLSDLSAGTFYWTKTNNNVTYTAGNIGIGTTTPTHALVVAGDIGPETSGTYDLGSSSKQFQITRTNHLFAAQILDIGGGIRFFNDTLTSSNNITLAFNTSILGTMNVTNHLISQQGINATTNICITGGTCLSSLSPILWTKTNNNLSYVAGRIGIGTTNVSVFNITVGGDIGPSENATYDLGSQENNFSSIHTKNVLSSANLTVANLTFFNNIINSTQNITLDATTINIEQGNLNFTGGSSVFEDNATCTIIYSPDRTRRLEVCD